MTLNNCPSCYNYKKEDCPFLELDGLNRIMKRTIIDCWCDKSDVDMCLLYCDEIEED